MIKTFLLFLIFPFFGCSQKHTILSQNYNFLAVDGEVGTLKQSNDTLYQLKCYINQPCQPRPSGHSRILSVKRMSDFIILKLESLDTIPLSIDPYPPTRFSVAAIKKIDSNQLGYLVLQPGLTKEQLDTVQTKIQSLKDKFFFTFFSDNYLKKLSSLKKITTKNEALEIIEVARSDKFKPLAERYSKTETRDMYGSGLSAEILNRACIEKGYSPIGAGRAINTFMKN